MVMMKLTGIYSEGTFKNNEDRLGGGYMSLGFL